MPSESDDDRHREQHDDHDGRGAPERDLLVALTSLPLGVGGPALVVAVLLAEGYRVPAVAAVGVIGELQAAYHALGITSLIDKS